MPLIWAITQQHQQQHSTSREKRVLWLISILSHSALTCYATTCFLFNTFSLLGESPPCTCMLPLLLSLFYTYIHTIIIATLLLILFTPHPPLLSNSQQVCNISIEKEEKKNNGLTPRGIDEECGKLIKETYNNKIKERKMRIGIDNRMWLRGKKQRNI